MKGDSLLEFFAVWLVCALFMSALTSHRTPENANFWWFAKNWALHTALSAGAAVLYLLLVHY